MTDDIVTHLRAVCNDSVYRADISVSRLQEAADEIERLETEILEINLLWNADKAEIERLRAIISELENKQMIKIQPVSSVPLRRMF